VKFFALGVTDKFSQDNKKNSLGYPPLLKVFLLNWVKTLLKEPEHHHFSGIKSDFIR